MLPPHQTFYQVVSTVPRQLQPEHSTHTTCVREGSELSIDPGHKARPYQHAHCLGMWQELQQGWEQIHREQSRAEEGLIRREVVYQPETLRYDERVLLQVALHDNEQGHKQALILGLDFMACLLCEQIAEAPQNWADEQLQALGITLGDFKSDVTQE